MTPLLVARRIARKKYHVALMGAVLLSVCSASTAPKEGPLVLEPVARVRRHDQSIPRDATSPQRVYGPHPVYPRLLREHRVEGRAQVAFVVTAEGTTRDVECVEANDRRFGDAAVEAVKQWRFTPARWQGKPLAMSMEVPIVFTLDDGAPASRSAAPSTADVQSPPAVVFSGDPRRDYEQLQRLQATRPPTQLEHGSDAYLTWVQARARMLHDSGMGYLSRYPTESRRWDVLLMLRYGRNQHIDVRRDGTKQLIPDKTEQAEWAGKYYPQLEQLLAALDASPQARAEALRQLISHADISVGRGYRDAAATMPAKALAWLELYERENPNSGTLPSLYRTVAMILNVVDLSQCRRFIQEKRAAHASDSYSDGRIRQGLDRCLRLVVGQEQPVKELWQQLQAMEPRLDVSAYRGKVVVIAWLAVDWSSRTIELEDLYRTHHDTGVEILQVAYYNENASAPAVQRDKVAMQRYVAAKQWPWRVVWDPSKNPEETFAQYWGQGGIPAIFVIGRDGCIVRGRPGMFGLDKLVAEGLARTP